MKEEVEKLTDDRMERIALTDTIISSLYHSDKETLSLMGIKVE